MKCPCENCLCVPICRNKHYFTLLNECSLVDKYVKISINHTLRTTQNILRPRWWGISENINTTTINLGGNKKEEMEGIIG